MKYPKEIKSWISNIRSYRGKKNGVVAHIFDAPDIVVKIGNSKRNYKRSGVSYNECQ